VVQDGEVNEQRNKRHAAQEERQADGGLDHEPDSTLVHDMPPLVKPRRIDVRQEVREQSDCEEQSRTVDDVLMKLFRFWDGKT
jgi:hypothetical protein